MCFSWMDGWMDGYGCLDECSMDLRGDHACQSFNMLHYDAIKWKRFPRYWPFVRGFHRLPRWIPQTNASDAELWCFLWSTPEQTVEPVIETPVIWGAIALMMTSLWWESFPTKIYSSGRILGIYLQFTQSASGNRSTKLVPIFFTNVNPIGPCTSQLQSYMLAPNKYTHPSHRHTTDAKCSGIRNHTSTTLDNL